MEMKKLTLLMMALLVLPAVPVAKALDVQPVAPQAAILEIFDYINAFRVENGLPKLVWNDQLADITEEHSRNMHDSENLNHYYQGKGPEDRLNDAGVKWSCYVENIAYNKGQTDKAKAAFDSWKKSDGHRKNMLDSCVTEGSVGWTGCEMMGHYFTFMAIKPAETAITRQNPVKISLKQGTSATVKLTIKNPNDSEMSISAQVTLKPSGIRFGIGPAGAMVDPGKEAVFTITVGAETANVGSYNGEVEISYDGGKLVYPVEITVTEAKQVKNTVLMWVGKSEYYVNNVRYTTSTAPTTYKGSAVVSVRMIADIFGAKVDYNAQTKTVTVNYKGIDIIMQVDNPKAKVAGVTVEVKPPPVIISSRLYVPLRFLVEAMGADVAYDAKIKQITITY